MPLGSYPPIAQALRHVAARRPQKRAPRGTVLMQGEVVEGKYVVRDLIGSGGMSEVYDAWDQTLDRHVAIKVSFPGTPSILKEAKILAAVRHSAAPVCFGVGVHRGVEYVAMERLYGINLYYHLQYRRIEGAPLSQREALDILIPIAECLAAVHRVGVAHRDLKSANVMLTPGLRPVLVDFGLACAEVDADLTDDSGTAHYMAPETITRNVQRGAAHLTDAYALGVLAHEILTFEVPYQGKNEQVLEQHLTAPILDLRDVRPGIAPELADMVASLLAKKPSERAQSMEAVAADLREIRDRAQPKDGTDPWSVLIVDDDAVLARTLRRLIHGEIDSECEVRLASDASEAVDLVRKRQPDVILLDMNMPRMNGIEMCMWLAGTHLTRHCQVISMSGSATEKDIALVRKLGAYTFLEKGEHMPAMLSTVLRKLRRQH